MVYKLPNETNLLMKLKILNRYMWNVFFKKHFKGASRYWIIPSNLFISYIQEYIVSSRIIKYSTLKFMEKERNRNKNENRYRYINKTIK